ncbi:MAG: hypothetical protein IPN34_10885 [Planctomycetes bacterium]|nr:hypothetical protein [Planctomycetota bacterium]
MNATTTSRVLRAAAALALSAPFASAQSLLGLENGSLAATGPLVQQIGSDCRRIDDCIARVLGPSIAAPFGGIALDARDGSRWITDGAVLAHLDADCNLINRCAIPATPGGGWTGLAFDPRNGALLFTTANNAIGRVRAACPVTAIELLCPLPASTPGATLTGIELDRFDGSLWVCDDTGFVRNVFVTATPGICRVGFRFQATCPGGSLPTPVDGLTLDRCAGEIYLSHGRYGIARFDLAGNALGCCSLPAPSGTPSFVGLAWVPAPPRRLGSGCSGPGCAPCTPFLAADGQSVTPNPSFALLIGDAQPGTRFFLWFNIAGGPIAIPGLCGPLQVAVLPPPLSVGPFPVAPIPGGTAPCDGGARIPLAIPLDPSLCGGDVFAQALGVCLNSAGLGLYLTNGLWLTVQ